MQADPIGNLMKLRKDKLNKKFAKYHTRSRRKKLTDWYMKK